MSETQDRDDDVIYDEGYVELAEVVAPTADTDPEPAEQADEPEDGQPTTVLDAVADEAEAASAELADEEEPAPTDADAVDEAADGLEAVAEEPYEEDAPGEEEPEGAAAEDAQPEEPLPVEEEAQPEELELVPDPVEEKDVLEEDEAVEEVAQDEGFLSRTAPMTILLAAAAAALVIGLLIGRFTLGGGGVKATGEATVTESQLDSAVGSYTYNGKTTQITAREVLEQSGPLDSAKDEEGNYAMPSADSVLNYARSSIIRQEAEAQGITVADEDIQAYATQLGAPDIATIAASYGMEEGTLMEILRSNLMMTKLRESIVGTDTVATMPEAPAQPEEGKESEATADYATYIIGLAGDEWNAKKGTWAKKDGPFAKALANFDITADGATYEAASTAYSVAYQLYAESQTKLNSAWNEYLNGIFSKVSIQIGSLVSQA